jgi:hypothetical protein
METIVYIDGYNLYYGAIKRTPYKWLNIAAMCDTLLPSDNIKQIKYFTALVTPRPSDPGQLTRQQTYHRALRTLPNLSIILGRFLTHSVTMARADNTGFVEVIKTEEKVDGL